MDQRHGAKLWGWTVPVGGGAAPGQVVVGTRRRPGDNGLLHCRHVSRVGLDERCILAGQHRPLVPAKLSSSVLEPNLEAEKT